MSLVTCQPCKWASLPTLSSAVQSTVSDLLDVLIRLEPPSPEMRSKPPNALADGERQIEVIVRNGRARAEVSEGNVQSFDVHVHDATVIKRDEMMFCRDRARLRVRRVRPRTQRHLSVANSKRLAAMPASRTSMTSTRNSRS